MFCYQTETVPSCQACQFTLYRDLLSPCTIRFSFHLLRLSRSQPALFLWIVDTQWFASMTDLFSRLFYFSYFLQSYCAYLLGRISLGTYGFWEDQKS